MLYNELYLNGFSEVLAVSDDIFNRSAILILYYNFDYLYAI